MSHTTVIYSVLEYLIFQGEKSDSNELITRRAYLSDMHKMRAVLISFVLKPLFIHFPYLSRNKKFCKKNDWNETTHPCLLHCGGRWGLSALWHPITHTHPMSVEFQCRGNRIWGSGVSWFCACLLEPDFASCVLVLWLFSSVKMGI